MSMVIVYDDHRDYRPAQLDEATRTRQLLGLLCPGDRVALASVSKSLRELGEPAVIKDLADLDDLLLRVEERREPRDYQRINQLVVRAAEQEWARPENRARADLLRVLVYFTRDLESKAPRGMHVPDFSWADPPYWLQGEALVALFKPIADDKEVKAWETFVIATPDGVSPDAIDQGLRVQLATWLEPARLKPKPPAPPKTKRAIPAMTLPDGYELPVDIPDPAAFWTTPDDAILWDRAWTPWVVAAGAGLLALIAFFWGLTRSRKRRGTPLPGSQPRDLTLTLYDRIHGSVLQQQRVRLDGALRVGPSTNSDVVVPGPFAVELLPGSNGASPRVRSTNSLVLEVQRRTGGRKLRATDAVPVPLRSGDRLHMGGGHELEVRYAGV